VAIPVERQTTTVFGRGGGAKKNSGELKGSEGETHISVESRVLLGANPRKNCNRFPNNNYKAEFGLKQHIICSAKLAHVRFHFSSP